MTKRSLLSILFLAFISLGLYAQEEDKSIEFDNTTHDFGDLKKGAPCSHVFKFTNVTDHPVKLTHVKASCGCTTPQWTRDAIEPGKTGEIKVSYDSNRIGPFNKSVRVMVDSATAPILIYIKGKIENTEEATAGHDHDHDGHGHEAHAHEAVVPSINYTVPRGAFIFEKMVQNLKEVTSEGAETVEFRFKNTSDKAVTITNVTATEEFQVNPQHKTVNPGQESKLVVTVDGKKMKEMGSADGYFSKRISISTDEEGTASEKSMTVNGTFKRVWSEEEIASSPQIEFETQDVNGGKVIEGEKFIYDFKFKNTGKSNLVIYSTKASCGCTASKPSKESIAPGETAAITAEFNSQGRSGKQSKTVTVKSNDVDSPVVTLKFTVEVVKDPFHAGNMMGGAAGNQ